MTEPARAKDLTRFSLNLRFSVLQGLVWPAFAVLFSFLVPQLRAWGYNNFWIGTITMMISLSSMVAQPLWGAWCDRHGHTRTLFVVLAVASCILVALLPYCGGGLAFVIVEAVLLSVALQTLPTLVDAWSVRLMNEGHPLDYSLTRSFGSFTFAVTAIGFGALLDWQGTWVRTPVYLILMAGLIGTALSTPAPHHAEHPVDEPRPASPFRQLARNRAFVVFLASVVLIGIGNGSLFAFYPVLIAQHGGTNAHLGLGLFLMALCEMPAMIFYSRIIARFDKSRALLALSILFFVVKNAAIALSPDLTWAIGLQVLQALSFGLYLPSAVHYMRSIVDPRASGTAQMIHSAAASGLGATIGAFVGGILAGPLGVGGMILTMSGACFLGYLIFALSQTAAAQKWMGVVYLDTRPGGGDR